MLPAVRTAAFSGFLCLFIIFISIAPALGGSISGTITNESDGEPLSGVKIIVKGETPGFKTITAYTDQTGGYFFDKIPVGKFSVSISLPGFEVFESSVQLAGPNESKTLDAALTHKEMSLNTVLVTASRRPEKILDAPASVSVVGSREIENRAALSPADYVKGQPAVDFAKTGINQSNMVVRGFNNVFSGALLVLEDNRIARVPSLRYNAYSFIPAGDDDIERIEMVSGPGSALYGPNAASGIMNIITKSPFESKGTTLRLGGGERHLGLGSIRHAGSIRNRIGYKISTEYYRGDDWKSSDPYEPDSIRLFRPTTSGPDYVSGWRPNNRDYKIEKIAGEARVDIIPYRDWYLVVDGGYNRANEIELTSLGAAQAVDWSYYYAQTRITYKDLFAQGYVNGSDAGDTYLLRTGQLIVDKSKVYSGQMQHHYSPWEKVHLIYGLDAILTRPNTESTINGRNEQKDDVNEYGGYLQTEVAISDKFRFTGAGRIDSHNRIEGLIFSPRAALTFRPDNFQNLRLTYNRAYSTPYNTDLFLDILQADDPFGVGAGFEPFVGFRPNIDVRVQGVPESGFHWRFGNAGPQFRSPFAPLDPRGLAPGDYIEFNDPVFTNVMWGAGREAVISGFESALSAFGIPQATIDTISTSMEAVTPLTVSGVSNSLKTFNLDTRSFDPAGASDISDIDRLEPTFTKTLELGYKGIPGGRFQLGVDLYRTEKENFVGPLAIETPNVFLDQASLSMYLDGEFVDALADPANAEFAAVLSQLDDPSLGGNGNGTPIDELTNLFAIGAAQIPFGTVTPQEAFDPDAVLVTFRNFGKVTVYGADISAAFRISEGLLFGGNFSYISKNLFKRSSELIRDVYLNSPKHKFGLFLNYGNDRIGLVLMSRLRFVDSFEMYGPFIGSRVSAYAVVDLSCAAPSLFGSRIDITVQNLFDYRHIEFVGAPRLGRLTIGRLSKYF